MVLKQLGLKRFKCWREGTIDFTPGINVVFGPNESGKSTLRAALMAVLFGNPTSQSETVEKWTSWGQTERCELRLEYWDRTGQVCKLRKDFAEHKMFFMAGEEALKTPKAIQQQLVDELGITSEEFYSLCASLDSKTLSDLGAARKQIGKMLAGLMTGAESGSDVLQAIKRLEESLKELNKGLNSPSKVPGPLKDLREKILLWTSERRKAETDLGSKREREQTFQKLQAELERDERRVRDLEHVLTANRKLQEAQKRREALIQQDQRFERLQQQRERLQAELDTWTQRLANDPISTLTATEYEQIRELTLREAQQSQLPQPEAGTTHSLLAFWVSGGALILGSGGLMVFGQWVLGLILLAGAALIWSLGWKRLQNQQAQVKTREAARMAQETLQVTLREQRQAWEVRLGLRLEEVLKTWPEVQQGLTQKNALERQMRDHEPVDEAQWSVVRRELRLLQDTLEDPALTPLLLKPLEMAQQDRDYQTLKTQVEEKRRQRDKLQALLEHDPINPDRLAEWDETLAEGKERLAYLEQQARIGQAALDGLERARKATLHPARQILETQAGEILSTISAGRYTQMSVNDEDLACQILVPETQRWDDPNVLSHGTFDQFYLSLRLALGDILASGKKPPLLLDDPFMTFDPERQARFLEWLKLRSREQQILFFTCRTEYHRYADNLIDVRQLATRATESGPHP